MKIKFEFDCQIIRISYAGFSALTDGYLIKFKDGYLNHSFEVNDLVHIEIENVEYADKEYSISGLHHIYVRLSSYLPNGFQFKNLTDKNNFFWSTRGFLTHKKFESDDLYTENSILKIIIKKYNSD